MKKFLLSLSFAALMLSAAQAQTVYFQEDFEWLEPWMTADDVADCVGSDDPSGTAPQISKKANTVEEQTAEEALIAKGYSFIRDCAPSKTPGECIYLQKNYLRFGKTGFQAGVILPSIDVPANTDVTVAFKWFSQRQGTGVIDPTKLVIKVANGEEVKVYDVPEHGWEQGHKLEWIPAEIKLEGATVTKDTKITIINEDSQLKSTKALRWHLDDIVVKGNPTSGITSVSVDENAPVEYYNVQGIRVANPGSGLYIVKQGNKIAKKLIVK